MTKQVRRCPLPEVNNKGIAVTGCGLAHCLKARNDKAGARLSAA
jgi:hypothetical protein